MARTPTQQKKKEQNKVKKKQQHQNKKRTKNRELWGVGVELVFFFVRLLLERDAWRGQCDQRADDIYEKKGGSKRVGRSLPPSLASFSSPI